MISSELNATIKIRLGRQWLDDAERAANNVLKLKKTYIVSVALVGRQKMKSLNRRYRNVDRPTDVLSFGGKTEEKFVVPKNKESLGEIVICPAVAKRNAKKAGHSLKRELQALYVHGLLHLLGHTHNRDSTAKKMFALQNKILQKIK